MESIVSQNIDFLKTLRRVHRNQFPQSRFNYTRTKMGASSQSLQMLMTNRTSRGRRSPDVSGHWQEMLWHPFDAEDLSRCLWYIIFTPEVWGIENFLSVSAASPQWKGIIVHLIPLIQELMMTPTLEEPALSARIRQIMNNSIDPPPHRNMEEAQKLIEDLKTQTSDSVTANGVSDSVTANGVSDSVTANGVSDEGTTSFFEIRKTGKSPTASGRAKCLGMLGWQNFSSTPQKLTNDLITLASRDKGHFYIVASKTENEVQVLLKKNRWITKITYSPVTMRISYTNS